MKFVVLDTETTGLEKKSIALNDATSVYDSGDEVIQIGGLVLDESIQPTKLFCHYCDCLRPCSKQKAYSVHGIDLRETRRYCANVFAEEVVWNLVPELLESDVTIIGYNVAFDIDMLAQSMANFHVAFGPFSPVNGKIPSKGKYSVDVLAFSRYKKKLSQLMPRYQNAFDIFVQRFGSTLSVESNIGVLFQDSWAKAHNALYDAIYTYLVFRDELWGHSVLLARK